MIEPVNFLLVCLKLLPVSWPKQIDDGLLDDEDDAIEGLVDVHFCLVNEHFNDDGVLVFKADLCPTHVS